MLKLRIEDDEGQETIVPLIRDEITIGRQEGNTIRLTERNVSRRHARLVRDEEGVWVEELSARYGVLVNGERLLERKRFEEDDVVLIGDYKLTLQSDRPAAAAEPGGEFNGAPTAIKSLAGAPPHRSRQEGTELLPAMPAKLVIVSSNFAGQEFPLSRKEMIIGRGEDCDIIIDHRSVSQRHAKILREAGGASYQIVDLNSKNGVRISGEKYTSTYIKRGDIVELGHVKFRFVEPGENYVFTPQSIIDDEPSEDGDASPRRNKKVMLLLVVGLVALLFIGVGALATRGMGGGGKTPQDGGQPTALSPDAVAANTPQDAGAPAASSSDKVKEGIAKARAQIEEGEIEKSLGVLEGLQYASPAQEDKDEIDKLLSRARLERHHQSTYRTANSALASKDHLSALRSLQEIPGHSLFAKIAADKSLRERAMDGAIEDAELAIRDGKREQARTQLTELNDIAPDTTRVVALLEGLNERAVVKNDTPPKDKTVKKPVPDKPAPPKMSREEADALAKAAGAKSIKGDTAGAIADCERALKGGAIDCYRILGGVYSRLGNTAKACSNYNKALKADPGQAGRVQTELNKLNCP